MSDTQQEATARDTLLALVEDAIKMIEADDMSSLVQLWWPTATETLDRLRGR